jgi:hypothetical protein
VNLFWLTGYLAQIISFDLAREKMDYHNFKIISEHMIATSKAIEA